MAGCVPRGCMSAAAQTMVHREQGPVPTRLELSLVMGDSPLNVVPCRPRHHVMHPTIRVPWSNAQACVLYYVSTLPAPPRP